MSQVSWTIRIFGFNEDKILFQFADRSSGKGTGYDLLYRIKSLTSKYCQMLTSTGLEIYVRKTLDARPILGNR